MNKDRAHHDMGGVSKYACEPIDTAAHTLTEFDRTVDAIRGLVAARGLMTVDELRRGIEALPEADYHRLSYYERWLVSITTTLLRNGAFTHDELLAAL